MYRNTRFGELMKGLSRSSFNKIVKEHKSDKYSKGFKSWDQLIAMIYTQVSGCRSLREVVTGFNSQTLHHYHLGTKAIKRSTLSDANANRDSEVFAQLCGQLLNQMGRTVRNEIKDLLYLIDSTSITLKGLGFDEWTKENKNNHTQGIKVHIMTEQSQNVPVYASITAANINDIEDGRKIPIEAGATYVFDKGYYDYNWWYRIHKSDAFFVSRFKHNAATNTIKAFDCGTDNSENILEDSLVEFKNRRPRAKHINQYFGTPIRRIIVKREDKSTPIILVTNDLKHSADEIALMYKQRWGIELFFKWLKQNLKIKQFLGRSENAVKIQIYTALITYILTHLYRSRNKVKLTLKMCLIELRSGLFQRPTVEDEMIRKRRQYNQELKAFQRELYI